MSLLSGCLVWGLAGLLIMGGSQLHESLVVVIQLRVNLVLEESFFTGLDQLHGFRSENACNKGSVIATASFDDLLEQTTGEGAIALSHE